MVRRRAFTIIELLVVVSIIALLVGILLPALGKARDKAKQTASLANLRQIATAHANYGSDWNDRQVTWIPDDVGKYGSWGGVPSIIHQQAGPVFGDTKDGQTVFYTRFGLSAPFYWSGVQKDFGTFRIMNAREFNQYMTGKFYSPIWYAPKDEVVTAYAEPCFDDPNEFCWIGGSAPAPTELPIPAWTSYVMSPAAMFNPQVFAASNGGFRDPWSLGAGFRSPSFSQAKFADLKTHVLEHHWLQGAQQDCNPRIAGGSYNGCEPYYFNLAPQSQPATLFFDGHIESMSVQAAIAAETRSTGRIWSNTTPYQQNGYFGQASLFGPADDVFSSYHIFTIEGIRGRDKDAG